MLYVPWPRRHVFQFNSLLVIQLLFNKLLYLAPMPLNLLFPALGGLYPMSYVK